MRHFARNGVFRLGKAGVDVAALELQGIGSPADSSQPRFENIPSVRQIAVIDLYLGGRAPAASREVAMTAKIGWPWNSTLPVAKTGSSCLCAGLISFSRYVSA